MHNEGLHDLHYVPHIMMLIRYKVMRQAKHVTRMGEKCILDSGW